MLSNHRIECNTGRRFPRWALRVITNLEIKLWGVFQVLGEILLFAIEGEAQLSIRKTEHVGELLSVFHSLINLNGLFRAPALLLLYTKRYCPVCVVVHLEEGLVRVRVIAEDLPDATISRVRLSTESHCHRVCASRTRDSVLLEFRSTMLGIGRRFATTLGHLQFHGGVRDCDKIVVLQVTARCALIVRSLQGKFTEIHDIASDNMAELSSAGK